MNDLHKQAQNELKHLIAEGMVKQVPGGYRLKTEKELEEEMDLQYPINTFTDKFCD